MAIVWVWATVRLPAAAQRLIRQAGLEDATRNLSTRRDPTGHRVGCPSEYPFLGPHAHECLGFQNSFQDPCCNTRNPVMPPKAFISFLIQYQAWWRRGHKVHRSPLSDTAFVSLSTSIRRKNFHHAFLTPRHKIEEGHMSGRGAFLARFLFDGADPARGWVDLLTGNCSLGFIVAGHQRV
ncbi:hypothetical protein MJO28_009308 [Puccinia striiformis f. sp. tritici]|uniref:Uncharacterized protein n=1 Tax=Puccinia striiformis f. sp. tritici TaxID=168172 RepID=A0ACC0E6R3_9BASI|nr:hypothetical protein MJO28_009308 [Puccinia striiformis f. sp. tritici]